MKAVLLSIQPKWCKLIASGEKTIEVRKTAPKLETPFKCYIYCTQGNTLYRSNRDGEIRLYHRKAQQSFHHHTIMNGKVVGEFICDYTTEIKVFDNGSIQDRNFYNLSHSCVPYNEMASYIGNGKQGYGWHISNLVIYDKPKEISEFTGLRKTKFGLEPYQMYRAPQSWCYVEELTNDSN